MTLFFSRSTVSGIMTHLARLNLSVLKLRIYVLTLLASRYSDKVSYNEVCKHCFVFSIPKLCYMHKRIQQIIHCDACTDYLEIIKVIGLENFDDERATQKAMCVIVLYLMYKGLFIYTPLEDQVPLQLMQCKVIIPLSLIKSFKNYW